MSFSRHLNLFSLILLLVMAPQTHGQSIQPIPGRTRPSLTSSGPTSTSKITVVNKSPQDGQIVKQGTRTSLVCTSNINWFFCVWKSPGGSKQCAIQQDSNPQNVCSGDERILLQGRGNRCEVELRNVLPEDHGQWTCQLTDPEHLGTDKSTINIEVAVPAKVHFDPGYGELDILRITEGETTKIRCAATGGYPAPLVSWSEPADSDIDFTAEPEIVTLTHDHTTNVFHTIQYRAALRDNNTIISCVATQLDHNGVDILYESSTALVLRVDKIVLPPIEDALTQKIGIISGVLLAIIFLILVTIFSVFVVCKRKRKRSRHPSSQVTDDTSPEQHTSIIKPIWTTSRGLVTSTFHNNKVYKEKDPEYQKSGNLEHHHNLLVQSQNHKPLLRHTSRATVSTQSTASQGSWEEDRSVGGEIEDASTQKMINPHSKIEFKTPSLHETHFDSEVDYPRTVIHPPDSYISYHPGRGLQRFQNQTRPSSSMAESAHPNTSWTTVPHYLSHQRPASAQGGPHMYDNLATRPFYGYSEAETHATSVKSVFDCDLGCFTYKDEDHILSEELVDTNPNASLETASSSGQTL